MWNQRSFYDSANGDYVLNGLCNCHCEKRKRLKREADRERVRERERERVLWDIGTMGLSHKRTTAMSVVD